MKQIHTNNGWGWLKGLTLVSVLCGVFLVSGHLAAEPAKADAAKAETVVAAVNINTADAETLAQALTGIGARKAQAIVAWRDANGGFDSLEQLTEVKGIGQATVEKNRHKLSL